MVVEAFLGGLVVIGGDEQGTVCTGLLGKAGEVDGFYGVVGAGSGQDLDATLDLINADFYDPFVFVVGKGCGFACGSTGNKTTDAFLDLPVYKGTKGVFINIAILEWGNDGCKDSGKLHRNSPWGTAGS